MKQKNSSRFGKGHIPWNKGISCKEETKKKISKANKGNKISPEQRAKIGAFHTGRKRSEETKRKMREARKRQICPKGKDHHFYGKKHTEESKQKMSEALKGKKAWSKGLTKKTNKSLLSISKKMKGNKNGAGQIISEKHRNILHEKMKGNKNAQGIVFTKERREKIGKANSIALRGNIIPQKVLDKMAKTKIKNGTQISPELLPEFERYKRKVEVTTRKDKKKLFDEWEGYCFYTKEYIREYYDKTYYNNEKYPVIDHKISILNGFNDKIKPEIIGGIDNLCICTRKINGVKRTKNNIDA